MRPCWRMTKGKHEVMLPLGLGGRLAAGGPRRGLHTGPSHSAQPAMPAQQVDSSEGHCWNTLVLPLCRGSRDPLCLLLALSPFGTARFACKISWSRSEEASSSENPLGPLCQALGRQCLPRWFSNLCIGKVFGSGLPNFVSAALLFKIDLPSHPVSWLLSCFLITSLLSPVPREPLSCLTPFS